MKTEKSIYFICGNLYPFNIGGYEVFNYYLMLRLKNSYSVNCLSSWSKPDYLHSREYCKIVSIRPRFIFDPLFFFLKLSKIKIKKAVVILSFAKSHWTSWWPYPLLNKIMGLKYILIIHGGGLAKWNWEYPYKLLFKKASVIVGISERISKEYNNRTGLKVELIPPLIPFEKYTGSIDDARKSWNFFKEEKIILYVGSLKKLKNPDTLVKAAIALGKNFLIDNMVRFIFAGDGPLKMEILSSLKIHDLLDHFVFLGNVEREKLSSLYASSDAYIITSEYEGTPLSLLEAMFHGLYIIASDAPGINNILTDKMDSLLFTLNDYNDLADKIKFMLFDPNKLKLKLNAKKKFIDNFSYDQMINRYKEIINKL